MTKLFLGLTGNIGSGKTTILKQFQNKGFKTLNADDMVHSMFLVSHNFYIPLAEQIDAYFNTSFHEQEIIDRSILRTLVKEDNNGLKVLANIVKPFITEEILKEKNNNEHDTIIEVPLLFETSNKDIYDKVILVYCDDEERKRRIKIRNPNWTDDYIQIMINSQMKQQEKLNLADYIVSNNNNENINIQIDNILLILRKPDRILAN